MRHGVADPNGGGPTGPCSSLQKNERRHVPEATQGLDRGNRSDEEAGDDSFWPEPRRGTRQDRASGSGGHGGEALRDEDARAEATSGDAGEAREAGRSNGSRRWGGTVLSS